MAVFGQPSTQRLCHPCGALAADEGSVNACDRLAKNNYKTFRRDSTVDNRGFMGACWGGTLGGTAGAQKPAALATRGRHMGDLFAECVLQPAAQQALSFAACMFYCCTGVLLAAALTFAAPPRDPTPPSQPTPSPAATLSKKARLPRESPRSVLIKIRGRWFAR